MTKNQIHHHSINVKSDHLMKLGGGSSVEALSELIWNALDAEATDVSISYTSDSLGGISSLSVRDNGLGMPYERLLDCFGSLGGSWKSTACHTTGLLKRYLHGRDGKGRFKGFSLGRVVSWTVRYEKNGDIWEYEVTLISDDPKDLKYTDEKLSSSTQSGVTVRISEIDRRLRSIMGGAGFEALSQRFALYLSNYGGIKIRNDGIKLNPDVCIESRKTYTLAPFSKNEKTYQIEYEVVQWKSSIARVIYLCNKEGFPLLPRTPKFQASGLNFVGYLRSEYFQVLQDDQTLDFIEMNELMAPVWDEVKRYTKDFRREVLASSAVSVVDQWKREEVYPYKEEASTVVEVAERQVFDIMAVQMNEFLPSFVDAEKKTKAFNLELLRNALETSPEYLEEILKKVLDLPRDRLKMLAELLEDTTLSNIIAAANVVAGRFVHIQGLEQLLFNTEEKKTFKERAQMQRILAHNPWIFGERYGLSVSDKSLTEVLRQHAGIHKTQLVIDHEVLQSGNRRGIVDLMLSRVVNGGHEDEIEHLIIELKSPTVTLTDKELTQIRDYAFAVAGDERFSVARSRWDFFLVSNKMNDSVKRQMRQKHLPRGIIFQNEENGQTITIWVKTWGEILQENKVRMTFYKDKLELNIDNDEALKRLKNTYRDVLVASSVGNELEETTKAAE